MRSLVVCFVSSILLSACGGGETINERSARLLSEQAQQTCASFGYKRGSPRYNECVANQKHNIKTERELRKQRNKRNADEWDAIFSKK